MELAYQNRLVLGRDIRRKLTHTYKREERHTLKTHMECQYGDHTRSVFKVVQIALVFTEHAMIFLVVVGSGGESKARSVLFSFFSVWFYETVSLGIDVCIFCIGVIWLLCEGIFGFYYTISLFSSFFYNCYF